LVFINVPRKEVPMFPLVLASASAFALPVPDDRTSLEGTWEMVSRVQGDRRSDDPADLAMRYKFWGPLFGSEEAGRPLDKGTFKLDPSRSPKAVDVTTEDGTTFRGVYELKGDVFRWCLARRGDPRPTALDSEQGTIGTFRRLAPLTEQKR
jgi:uncharacterized protein (TIGR03067 family)